jgi:UTP--glucose-1-phosphate uridylyltransferase
MDEQSVYTYEFEGVRYDAGTVMGWLEATVDLALQRPDLAATLRSHIQSLDL